MTYLPPSLTLTEADEAALISDYKYFHAHPELSLQEFETTRVIRERAEALHLSASVSREIIEVGSTGTVVILRNGEGPTVAYRADIDALPIKEQTGLEYASTVTGHLDGDEVHVMHGCGHDTHITMGLATMEVFARSGGEWSGTLQFIFQPGEEGKDGAKLMISQGLWEKIDIPDVLYGQHVFPGTPGHIALTHGPTTSAVDSLRVTLRGKGGHGSQPQDTIDPIVLAAHIIVRLQTVVSRTVGPLESAVVTVGSFHAGTKENIIPDTAEMKISIRSATPDIRERVLTAVTRIIRAEAAASGADEPEIENYHASNVVMNDQGVTERAVAAIRAELGDDRVTYDPSARIMASEDFGELGDAAGIPYSFWFLGGSSKAMRDSSEPISNHSPFFAPQPEVTLAAGVRAATAALYSWVRPTDR